MVSRCVLSVFCLFVWTSGTLSAQTISAPAKVTGKTGELLAVRVAWEGSEVRYTSSPGLNVIREYDPDAKVLALRAWTDTAGEYSITLIAASDKGKLTDFTTVTLVITNKAPQPPPPTPTPVNPVNPTPVTPKAATCWVIVVEQSGATRDLATARVLTDRAVWQAIETAGSKWAVLQSEDPVAVTGGYAKAGDRVGFPALLMVSDAGAILSSRPLKSSDDIRNAFKEITGK